MKNKLLFGILAILLISIIQVNAAPSPPFTFAGEYHLFGEECNNCEIEFRYMDSKEDNGWKTTKVYKGWYQFTNKLFKDGDWYRPGDRVEVRFCDDKVASSCLQVLRFTDGAGTMTHIQIEKSGDYKILNSRGRTLIIKTDEKEVVIIAPRICEDGSEPIDGKCPADFWDWAFKLALGVLAAFGFGIGFVKGLATYYFRKGTKLITEGKMYDSPEMIAEGKKFRARAIKMTMTAIKNAALGKYDRHRRG